MGICGCCEEDNPIYKLQSICGYMYGIKLWVYVGVVEEKISADLNCETPTLPDL
jgi:hypothetical protein